MLEPGDIVIFRGEFVPAGLANMFGRVLNSRSAQPILYTVLFLMDVDSKHGYAKIMQGDVRGDTNIYSDDIGGFWAPCGKAKHFRPFIFRNGKLIDLTFKK